MKNTKKSYLVAKNLIAEYAAEKQNELDAAAAAALAKAQAECRTVPLSCVSADDQLYPLAVVLADGLTITPRESDGYPAQSVSVEAQEVLLAAIAAGMPVTTAFSDMSLRRETYQGKPYIHVNNVPGKQTAYDTWMKAKEYRERQTYVAL